VTFLTLANVFKAKKMTAEEAAVRCLVALNRIEQVEFHLKKALENGLMKEELVAAITHIAFYAGWPTAASGFSHLKKVIDQQ